MDVAGFHVEYARRRARHGLQEFLGRALGERIGAVVDGHHGLGPNQFARGEGGVRRIHGEVAADGHQHQVGFVVLRDQLHVAENAGIAHVPDAKAVFHLEDVPDRFAARMGFRPARRRVVPDVHRGVLGLHCRHVDARGRRHASALVEARQLLRRQHAQGGEGLREVAGHPQADVVLLRQRGRVADMVAVAVGDQQRVDPAQRVEVLVLRRGDRVGGEPRIDHDHLAAGRDDAERGLAQPLHFDLALGKNGRSGQAQAGRDDGQQSLHGNLLGSVPFNRA
jgi:hypothetical protein